MDDMAEMVMLEGCQKGNTSAFESLFEKYKLFVFRDALLMTGTREKADDVLQEVFVTVWKSINKYNPKKAKFTTWLHRITMNRCIDYFRKDKERLSKLDCDIDMDKYSMQEENMVNIDDHQRLITAMNCLDHKHRSTLILRFYDDLSYKEISDALDIPMGTVKSRIHNGLCMLRGQL